jgi:hypothetical protein
MQLMPGRGQFPYSVGQLLHGRDQFVLNALCYFVVIVTSPLASVRSFASGRISSKLKARSCSKSLGMASVFSVTNSAVMKIGVQVYKKLPSLGTVARALVDDLDRVDCGIVENSVEERLSGACGQSSQRRLFGLVVHELLDQDVELGERSVFVRHDAGVRGTRVLSLRMSFPVYCQPVSTDLLTVSRKAVDDLRREVSGT